MDVGDVPGLLDIYLSLDLISPKGHPVDARVTGQMHASEAPLSLSPSRPPSPLSPSSLTLVNLGVGGSTIVIYFQVPLSWYTCEGSMAAGYSRIPFRLGRSWIERDRFPRPRPPWLVRLPFWSWARHLTTTKIHTQTKTRATAQCSDHCSPSTFRRTLVFPDRWAKFNQMGEPNR